MRSQRLPGSAAPITNPQQLEGPARVGQAVPAAAEVPAAPVAGSEVPTLYTQGAATKSEQTPAQAESSRRADATAQESGAARLGWATDHGPLTLFGVQLPRVAAPIRQPNIADRAIAQTLGDLFAHRGLFKKENVETHRSEAAIAAAMSKPLLGKSLGPLTLYRPGLGNTSPGPAQIARLAQHTDKLVIAYANPGEGAERQLRPLTEIDGVPLPDSLRGKVFAIGSPKNLTISFEQGSDLFLEQLGEMAKSPLMKDVNLEKAHATVIGHSQGGLDATLTRKRLEAAGLPDVIEKLGTLATPFGGSPISDERYFGLFTELGERALHLQTAGAMNALDPDHLKKVITPADERLVDASIIGEIGGHKTPGRGNVRDLFKVAHAALFVGELFKGHAGRESDGLVTVAAQQYGKSQVRLAGSHDHAFIAEDPLAADALIMSLGT